MKAFFDKYGGGQGEPYHAIEMMCHLLYEVKEKVERGDKDVNRELGELSEMIEDYFSELETNPASLL